MNGKAKPRRVRLISALHVDEEEVTRSRPSPKFDPCSSMIKTAQSMPVAIWHLQAPITLRCGWTGLEPGDLTLHELRMWRWIGRGERNSILSSLDSGHLSGEVRGKEA